MVHSPEETPQTQFVDRKAAKEVFSIPELTELILLALFGDADTTHTEIRAMRTLLTAQPTSRTWHDLVQSDSSALRQKLYLPTKALDMNEAIDLWTTRSPFPHAHPNPWIPFLLLNQRSWGSAYPFDTVYSSALSEGLGPSKPRFWTWSLELSRAQYGRLPPPGRWREQFVTWPPFTDFWYTRSFYELGSGRAPFVTHLDYNPKKEKTGQKYRSHREGGVTLGDLVDAWSELFEKHPAAKFVMVESLRPSTDEIGREIGEDDKPRTKMYLPGSSAERSEAWQ